MKKLIALLAPVFFVLLASSCADKANTSTKSISLDGSGIDYRKSKSRIVVLNFFDMYCIHCQRDAKHVNDLYERIKRGPHGKDVAFYGIGWGNSPVEVEMYRKKFGVKYPLIADPDKSISRRFGKVRTPLIVVLKKQGSHWVESLRISKIKNKKDMFCVKVGDFCMSVKPSSINH